MKKGSLTKLYESILEVKKYPCDSYNHQAAHISSLLIHKRSIHEGKKYPCDSCDYLATAYKATFKANLYTHRKQRKTGETILVTHVAIRRKKEQN